MLRCPGSLCRWVLASAVAVIGACSKCGSQKNLTLEPSRKDGGTSSAEPPEPLVVTESRSDLIFSYRDPATGAFETATTIQGIPAAARRSVVVTDLSRTPEERQAGRYIFVADLRRPRADGTFAAATASRYGFEEQLSGTSTSTLPAGKNVIVYSARWCGVCAKAKRLLGQWGVSYVEKDVEASRSAAAELAAKANRQNVTPSGVPVIDVAGTLLFGLDEQALRDALRQHGFLRASGR